MKILMFLIKLLFFVFFATVTYFTFDLDQAVGIILLVTLVIAQLWFLSSRIRRVGPPAVDPQRTVEVIKGLAAQSKRQRRNISIQPPPRPGPTPPLPEIEPPSDNRIDSTVFSKFQENLGQAKKKPAPPEVEPNEVVLNLSKKVTKKSPQKQALAEKQPAAPPTRTGQKPKKRNPYAGKELAENFPDITPVKKGRPNKEVLDNHILDQVPSEPLGDLFDHLEERADSGQAAQPITPKPRRPQHDTESNRSPLTANETLELTGLDNLDLPETGIDSLQLKAAQKTLRAQEFHKAAELAQTWVGDHGKNHGDLKEVLSFVAVASDAYWSLKDYPAHLKLWQSVFGGLVPKSSKEYLPLLEERIDEYVKLNLEDQAVPFLLTALSVYKAQEDHLRMEGVYRSLEKAYTTLEDEKALTQCLSGHLGVKRTLKDHPGQLELLDQLGKRLYAAGDHQGSRQCYEDSLEIKQQIQTANG